MLPGIDHYPDCVHELGSEDVLLVLEKKQGTPYLGQLVKTYWERYGVPIDGPQRGNARPGDAVALLVETHESSARH